MRICFILPGITNKPIGGFKIVYEYASRLASNFDDLEITICFLDLTYAMKQHSQIPFLLRYPMHKYHCAKWPTWFQLPSTVKKKLILKIDDKSIPDGDWIFATSAPTATAVAALSPTKGKKGYFIQGYETWFMPKEELHKTYNLGLTNIAVSSWLKSKVDSVSSESCFCIPNPVDSSVFYPSTEIHQEANTIAVLYHTDTAKGFDYAWDAIQNAKKEVSGLHVKMFGARKKPANLPDWIDYTENATQQELFNIYNSSSAFVCASINEGYGLTCVEALACGCPLIISNFPGSYDYSRPNINSLVSPLKDSNAMAQNIVTILKNPELQKKLRKGGIETIKKINWNSAIKKFYSLLNNSN